MIGPQMRKRIVTLAVLAATLATSLFGIPLAIAAAQLFLSQEATELEHTADIAALDVSADLIHARQPGQLLTSAATTSLALYGPDGRLVDGHGPARADPVVQQTLADSTIEHQSGPNTLIAAVPIPDQAGGNYAVRASTPTSEVYPKIALTWLGMLGLEVVIITLTWQLARWQARRLARPLESLAGSASLLADGDFTVRAKPSGISEIDTAATSLNHAAARIGELVDRERAVTAHASHQLRTPLAGLRLCLENALHTPGADYPAATHEAVAAADRLERTIDDLIMLARTHERRTEPIDIPVLLNEIKAARHDVLVKSRRSLRIVIDPDLRPPHASTAAARQILAVLVDNAIRHGTGQITIHARESTDTVAIDVSDEGAGLGIDDTGLDGASADGHGMGLPLARSLAEAEGGRLVLTSRAPTTFTLFLLDGDY
jgi:signal transduction histidine kinase